MMPPRKRELPRADANCPSNRDFRWTAANVACRAVRRAEKWTQVCRYSAGGGTPSDVFEISTCAHAADFVLVERTLWILVAIVDLLFLLLRCSSICSRHSYFADCAGNLRILKWIHISLLVRVKKCTMYRMNRILRKKCSVFAFKTRSATIFKSPSSRFM